MVARKRLFKVKSICVKGGKPSKPPFKFPELWCHVKIFCDAHKKSYKFSTKSMFCISYSMLYPALNYAFKNLEVGMYQDTQYWLQTQDPKKKRGQEKRSYSNTSQHISGLNVKKGGGEVLKGIIGQGIWLWHPGLPSLRKRDIAHFVSSLSLEEAEGTM